MKTVEQQQAVKTPKGWCVATVAATLKNSRLVRTTILSVDSPYFETKEEAEVALHEQA